jgi:transcriptional regulator with XRE-family HTH domain
MQTDTMRGTMPAVVRRDALDDLVTPEPARRESAPAFEPLPESFGRRLRAVRERQRISIAEIAESTKILGALLDGLEHDDVSRWPTGLYRRAFIRAYATAIGLDPEPVVREFMARFPDPEDAAVPLPVSVATAPRAVLRLTLAEPGGLTSGTMGQLAGRRVLAVATDLIVIGSLTAALYLAIGMLWAPLAVATLVYYLLGTLAFGTTPGACLAASTTGRPANGVRVGGTQMPWSPTRERVAALIARLRAW